MRREHKAHKDLSRRSAGRRRRPFQDGEEQDRENEFSNDSLAGVAKRALASFAQADTYMIVKMKKIILITQSKDIDSALESVRELGLLHIEHEGAPSGEDITALKEKLNRVSKTIAVLPDIKNQAMADDKEDGFVDEIARLLDEKETLIEELQMLKRDIEIWEERS